MWAQEVQYLMQDFHNRRYWTGPKTMPVNRTDRGGWASVDLPSHLQSKTSSGWEKMLGRNLQVLVKVITLVSLHLICSLTDFQTVEWVNKVPQGTPAGDGLPQGCTHKRSRSPTTRCELQTKALHWTSTRELANFINLILDWTSCYWNLCTCRQDSCLLWIWAGTRSVCVSAQIHRDRYTRRYVSVCIYLWLCA